MTDSMDEEFEDKEESHDASLDINKIPIKNLWFLMYYATKHLGQIKNIKAESETLETPDYIPILATRILIHTVELRLKRNLHFNYQPRQEILRRVRGRIDLLKTERRQLLQKAQIACRFDEFTIDTPRNCFVRDALDLACMLVLKHNKERLHGENKNIIERNIDIANKCKTLSLMLRRAGVVSQSPTYKNMRVERFGRHDINDRQMVSAALLIYELTMPREIIGSNHLLSPFHKEKRLWELYENGIAGFYKMHYNNGQEWTVAEQTRFSFFKESDDKDKKFPIMQPDIILRKKATGKIIVIDTKFTSALKQNKYGKYKLHNPHIYQILAYATALKNKNPNAEVEGMLLYPNINEEGKEDIDNEISKEIHGFRIRFTTVNLAESEEKIGQRLLEIIES